MRPERQATSIVALVAVLSSPSSAGDARLPHAPVDRPAGFDAARVNADCERCHDDIAREWRSSMHRGAYEDPEFALALALEPLPFCRGCHAPEAPTARPPPPHLAQLGVACVTCHVPSGDVLAATRDGAPAARTHPVRRSASFANEQACAGCHDFKLPGATGDDDASYLQLTVHEHARSRFAAQSCAHCHMPQVDGPKGRHRSHAFAVDRALVAAALDVKASRDGDRARVTLSPADVGHAVPTGDLFRRLSVTITASSKGSEARLLAKRYLGRRDVGPGRPYSDDRVSRGPVTIEARLDGVSADDEVRFVVSLERVRHPTSTRDDEHEVGAVIEAARGVIR